MKHFIKYGLMTLLFCSCFSTRQVSPTQTNPNITVQNQVSNPTFVSTRAMNCNHKVLEDGDSIRIFLELDIPRLAISDGRSSLKNEFVFNYGLLNSYNSKDFFYTAKISLNDNNIQKTKGLYYVDFTIEKRTSISSILVLDIADTKTGQKLIRDIPVSYTITKIREQYALFDKSGKIPVFSNYILAKDTFQIKNLKTTSQSLVIRHFAHLFEPASPPMTLAGKLPPKNLGIDSFFTIQSNKELHFDKTGLYLVQADTSQFYGLSFYVVENKYPKLSKVKDLIGPLIYITTEEELKELTASAEAKKDMDKLWLKLMSGNVKTAKQTIEEYYKRVKVANQSFTSYKEGWKTDMGMIYIIFGKPSRIVKTNDKELWSYTQNSNFSEINFTFIKKPNQFLDEHFTLIRYPEYEQIWYPVIEAWRSGKVQ